MDNKPHTHSMIADPSTIESGLRTMFETANGKVAEVKKGKKKHQCSKNQVLKNRKKEWMGNKYFNKTILRNIKH